VGSGAPSTYVLVDQDDANVLALLGEALEGRLDRGVVRLVADDDKVALRVRALRDVLESQSVGRRSGRRGWGRVVC
jgi:hypothetical protein